MSSAFCVWGSITQKSGSRTSSTWLAVRLIMPTKMEVCCAMSSTPKATPKIVPRYLARSPVSIFQATHLMAGIPSAGVDGGRGGGGRGSRRRVGGDGRALADRREAVASDMVGEHV